MSQRGIEFGKYCEARAVRFLKKNGYRILERNYRCAFGEIDAIAEESGYVVFIEIKSQASLLFGPPYLRITNKKKKNITNSALSYLKKYGLSEKDCRIDVVSVCLLNGDYEMELIKNAFEMSDGG